MGRPVHDDGKLFEMLILEGMQAGLSWITTIAYSVDKAFPARIKDMRRVAKALVGVADAKRFFIAVQSGEIAGVIVCTDYTGRALQQSEGVREWAVSIKKQPPAN